MKKRLDHAFIATSLLCSLVFAESPKTENKMPTLAQSKTPMDPTQKPESTLPDTKGALIVKEGPVYFPGGCGFRKALGGLVKVYEICFYGKDTKATEWATALDAAAGEKSYKLKLSFLRGVGGKNVSAAFSEGLSKTPAAQKLEEMERQKFLAWAAKLKIEKESVMEFTFNEAKPMKVTFVEKATGSEPQLFETEQKGLAKATAAIWFGDKPLNDDLKKDLLK